MKKTYILILFLSMALLLHSNSLFSIDPVKATVSGSFTLYPINDTLTSQYHPDSQPWFDDNLLQLGYDNNTTPDSSKWGWLKFNISEGWRGNITITGAKFHFYLEDVNYGETGSDAWYNLYSIDYTNESWVDSTITWNNQPSLEASYEEKTKQQIGAENQYYYWYLKDAGSGYGVDALQTAYDNNRTKTYVARLNPSKMYFMAEWRALDYGSNLPKLTVYYDQEEEEPGEEEPPVIPNPRRYKLTFYPIADSSLNSGVPGGNYGDLNVTQIKYSKQDGVTIDLILKFDLAIPDLIDGVENTFGVNLSEKAIDILSINLIQYCEFSPYYGGEGIDWRAYNVITGIDRSDEDWNETLVTWNTKPEYRGDLSLTSYVDAERWYSYSFLGDENFIRESILNGSYYSLIHRVDQIKDQYGYSNWRMREYDTPFIPYIEMDLYTTYIDMEPPLILTFNTAHIFLARSWSLTPFIAGHLLCAMILTAIMIPIAYISRKLIIVTFGTMGLCTLFLSFGWLHIGVFIFVLVFTLLTQGSKIKRWLG